ncbi:kinase-regulated stress-responsive transcription factor skn7 [Tulasnella sp. 418]|nr:kinase-regulated stress-responsive transcription factor skn7 [Tulasnella sp. 418]
MLSNGVPSIVSPWYPNGNLKEYLELNPKAGRHSLVNDVAKALSYLHSISVVHGDIKAENVLIDAEGVASLCDFGLSQFLDEAVRITGFTTTQANTGGTDRYLCPELLEEDKKTTMSDMWAFACLIMLILTDEIPHARVTSRAMVFNAILRGTHPYTKPDKPIKESLWSSVVKCWSISPVDRPSASDMESLILLEILVENNSSSQTEVVTAQPSASSLSSDTSPSSSSDPPVMSSIKTPEFPPPAVLNYPITSKGLGMDDILPKPSTKVPVDTILTGPTIVPGWAVPPHVLLVDDDSARRKLYSRFLRVCGCTIDVAVDGVGAVNKVNLEKYDLVLMDIIMPKLDGVSATSLIRQFDDTTPIISMTNNLKPNEVSTYISNGMNDILPTPFTKENLFTMLEKHLGHLKQQTSKPYIDTSDPSSSKQLLNGMMEDQYSTMMLHRLLGGNSGVTDAFDGVAIETNAMRNTLKRGLEEVDDDGTTGKRGRFEVLE